MRKLATLIAAVLVAACIALIPASAEAYWNVSQASGVACAWETGYANDTYWPRVWGNTQDWCVTQDATRVSNDRVDLTAVGINWVGAASPSGYWQSRYRVITWGSGYAGGVSGLAWTQFGPL